VCFGASQAVLGNGLLFDCDCLALIRAREYNCGLLRHDNWAADLTYGFSPAFKMRCFSGRVGMNQRITNEIVPKLLDVDGGQASRRGRLCSPKICVIARHWRIPDLFFNSANCGCVVLRYLLWNPAVIRLLLDCHYPLDFGAMPSLICSSLSASVQIRASM
jgi:hypothetical protein